MENDFLANDKVLSTAKKSFSIFFTSKYVLFSLGNIFLSKQKIFCPGRWMGHFTKFILLKFVLSLEYCIRTTFIYDIKRAQFFTPLIQIILQGIKQSSEDIHWDIKTY